MTAVALTIDGVLRKMATGTPIPAGIKLYRALATQFTVTLLSDEREDDEAGLQHWLESEGLQEHTHIQWSDVVMDQLSPSGRRLQQVARASRVNSLDLVIEPNPETAAYLLLEGWNVLMINWAAYMLPSWRPDYREDVQPWDSLQKQVADAARLRAMDSRK
jgi:hypothetical protein